MEQQLYYYIGQAIDIQVRALRTGRTRDDRTKYNIRIRVYCERIFLFFFYCYFLRFFQDWRRLCRESANTYDIVSILDVLNAARETDNGKVRVTRFDRFMKDVILFLSKI